MPVNRNALIRYKTIDHCLCNPYRLWTLDNLVDACSNALYEYEGIDKGVSKRTVQMDIQVMRSEKLGYNAPIIVYDKKYYKYEDPEYSITNTPLNNQDMRVLLGAVEVLKQFKGFSYFSDMIDIVSRLEDHVTSFKQKTISVIDFEKNDSLTGMHFLDAVYQAILKKKVLDIAYKSFKAHSGNIYCIVPYLLKEHRNRWFVLGLNLHNKKIINFALDRIISLSVNEKECFIENTFFNTHSFFDDVIGVTKHQGNKPAKVVFWASPLYAPYIETKPLHSSQQILETHPDQSKTVSIQVILNYELERDLLAFGEGVRVLSPRILVKNISRRLHTAAQWYGEIQQGDNESEKSD